MIFLKPPALQKGNCIGVMATSSYVDKENLNDSEIFLKDHGYDIYTHPQTYQKHKQSAGSADEKVKAFHDLFTNPDIQMIMSARGGNRAITMLDKIDFGLIRDNPKIIIGYSDLTILLNAIYTQCGLITFHGPLYRELPTHKNYTDMIQMLSGDMTQIDLTGSHVLKDGHATGKLIGGNLSLFQTLIGTDFLPDMEGTILFLEDIGDHISRYDRMFGHLRVSGILNKISALIVGQFTDMQDSEDSPFGFALKEIIEEHTTGLNIPVMMNAPFGHGADLPTFPIGCAAKLDGTTLTLLEKPVS